MLRCKCKHLIPKCRNLAWNLRSNQKSFHPKWFPWWNCSNTCRIWCPHKWFNLILLFESWNLLGWSTMQCLFKLGVRCIAMIRDNVCHNQSVPTKKRNQKTKVDDGEPGEQKTFHFLIRIQLSHANVLHHHTARWAPVRKEYFKHRKKSSGKCAVVAKNFLMDSRKGHPSICLFGPWARLFQRFIGFVLMSAQDLPVVHRDNRCLGIGFAMSFVSLSGAFFRLNRLKHMMVGGVWPFVVGRFVFTQTHLHLCRCFFCGAARSLLCSIGLESAIIHHAHFGWSSGAKFLPWTWLQRMGAPSIPLFCLLDHDFLRSQKLKQHAVWRCLAQTWPLQRMRGNGQVCFLFPRPTGDTLHTISETGRTGKTFGWLCQGHVGGSRCQRDCFSTGASDCNMSRDNSLVEAGLVFPTCQPRLRFEDNCFGFSCFKMAQNLWRQERRASERLFRQTGKRSFYAAGTGLGFWPLGPGGGSGCGFLLFVYLLFISVYIRS